MSNLLANTLLANLSQTKNKLVLDPKPVETVPNRIIDVPLGMLHIDARQPRQFLPAGLRAQVLRNERSAIEVMAQLITQAESGSLEMQGYIESLAALAQSITEVGLQQPLRVSQERRNDGRTRFVLVDGERRFWALIYRICTEPTDNDSREQQLTSIKVPALLHDEHASADDIQRAQWAANQIGRAHV